MKKSKFQFNNPNLTYLTFELNDDFKEELFESIKLAAQTKVMKFKEQNKANVELSLNIGGTEAEFPFELKIAMMFEFVWEDGLDETLVDTLLKVNAPSLILSYLRPIVATITNNSKYAVLNLPYLDMQDNEAVFEET